MRKIIAVLCGDLHITNKRPIARADENWFDAQKRPLREIKLLAKKHRCPVICSGDVFDKHNPNPETINFAIKHLPKMFAVPGNHDLPFHRYEDIQKSGYWTLVEAGIITNLPPDEIIRVSDYLSCEGFPWGFGLHPRTKSDLALRVLAVVHKYCWIGDYKYTGATGPDHATELSKSLRGYAAILVGDNHSHFSVMSEKGPPVMNVGGLMRRRIDEIDFEPTVGLLYSDNTFGHHELDCSEDKFIDVGDLKTVAGQSVEMEDFLESMKSLGDQALDFVAATMHFLEKNSVCRATRKIILQAIEQHEEK